MSLCLDIAKKAESSHPNFGINIVRTKDLVLSSKYLLVLVTDSSTESLGINVVADMLTYTEDASKTSVIASFGTYRSDVSWI